MSDDASKIETQTRVGLARQNLTMRERGKPDVFTDAQNDVLRRALDEWIAREFIERGQKEPTQAVIGERLGISQQNVGKFRSRYTGASYQTGTAIAQLIGFSGVDALLAGAGLHPRLIAAAPAAGVPSEVARDPWQQRSRAAAMAIEAGAPGAAISRVYKLYGRAPDFAQRPLRFWLDVFLREADAEAAPSHMDRATAPPSSGSVVPIRKRGHRA